MIALIALIAAVVIVGGGIEALRRARFGARPSAAHHRALDRLGHITTQSADTATSLVEAEEPELLSHVRRAVESDRAQPRINPQPVSRPVAVPAITGGPNFVGTVPGGQMPGRGPDTEIEGVRLLVPEPEPSEEAAEDAGGDDPDTTGQVVLADDDPDTTGQVVLADDDPDATGQLVLPGEDEWDDEAEWGPEGDWDSEGAWDSEADWDDEGAWGQEPAWADGDLDDRAGTDIDSPAGDADALVNEPADDGQSETGVGPAGGQADPPFEEESAWSPDELAAWEPEDADGHQPGPLPAPVDPSGTPEAAPAAAASWQGVAGWESVLHQAVGHLGGPAWDEHRGDDASAGSFSDEPADAPAEDLRWAHDDQAASLAGDAPTQQLRRIDEGPPEPDPAPRIIRIDDLGGGGWPEPEPAPPIGEVGEDVWDGPDDTGSLAITPFEDDEPEDHDSGLLDGGRDENGQPIVMRFDDLGGTAEPTGDDGPDLRPRHVSAGAGRQAGAIPGLTPDETRAQLAALAQSGGMGAVPASGRRRHHRRSRNRGHRVASAIMLLAAVVIFGGAVYLVATSSSGSHHHRSPTAAHTPAAKPAAPSTTAPPAASLVSQTKSTATYQVSGSPTIGLTFTSSCWTEIRQGSSSGPLVFEGTETAGSTRQLTGPVWVRLGDPAAVQVTVGGTALVQPAMTSGSPFNLQFQ